MTIVTCPHCGVSVLIAEINCAIFRHGVFKNTFHQIPPHATKTDCDEWKRTEQIYGCGKPFKLVNGVAIKCDYI